MKTPGDSSNRVVRKIRVRAILFLVRDADYITGHIVPVDGGRSLNI